MALETALFVGAVLALRVRPVCAATCSPPPTIQLGLRNCSFSAANQTDVFSWGVLLGVGGAAEVCMTPSTVVNSTLLESSEICSGEWLRVDAQRTMTPAQCRSRRGGFVDRRALPAAPTTGLDSLNPGWANLMRLSGLAAFPYAARAPLQIRDVGATDTEGLITQGQQHTTGHLGLAERGTLLAALKAAGLVGALSWGLNAGSRSAAAPRDGSLVLGGYDESSVDGPFFNYSIAQPNILNNRPCPLQISLTGMTLTVANGNGSAVQTKEFTSDANKLAVCIEPYDNLFRLPGPYLQDIKSMLAQVSPDNTTLVDASQYPDLYNLEPGLVYRSSAGPFDVTLEITIDNGLTVTVPTHELVRPLRGLDANGREVVDTRFTEVQFYGEPAIEDGPVLGKAFLSQVYLFVDLETSTFHLAQQNLEANTPLPKSSAPCPRPPALTKTDKGLVGVGAVLAALLVAGAAYGAYRWLMRRREAPAAPGLPPPAQQQVSAAKPGVAPVVPQDDDDDFFRR